MMWLDFRMIMGEPGEHIWYNYCRGTGQKVMASFETIKTETGAFHSEWTAIDQTNIVET